MKNAAIKHLDVKFLGEKEENCFVSKSESVKQQQPRVVLLLQEPLLYKK